MMARSGTPAEAAAVAGRFETAGRVGGVGRHGGGDRRQAGHLPAPAKRLEAGPVGAVRLDRIPPPWRKCILAVRQDQRNLTRLLARTHHQA